MNENGWRLESWFNPLLNCVSSLSHWLIHPICGLYKSSLWPNDMGRINICRHPNKANAHLLKEAIPLVLLSSNLDGQLSLFRNELDSLRMPARYAKRCKAGPRNYQDGIQHLDAIANEHNCTTVARGSETYWSRCEKKRLAMNCHFPTLSVAWNHIIAFSGDALLAKLALFQSTEAPWRRPKKQLVSAVILQLILWPCFV